MISTLLSTYVLLGTYDFRSAAGQSAPVPTPSAKAKADTEQVPNEEETTATATTTATEDDSTTPDKTEKEKEKEEFTLLGKGEDDEYTVAQQYRDQQAAAEAAAKAVHIQVSQNAVNLLVEFYTKCSA